MWKDYLSFSRQEQKGLIILACIILLLVFYRLLVPLFISTPQIFISKEDSLFQSQNFIVSAHTQEIFNQIPYFDPNEVSYQFLVDIGLDARTAGNWVNYLKKGGSFNKVDDVSRIYGIDSTLLAELKPYMHLQTEKSSSVTQSINPPFNTNFTIDLNRIDKNELLSFGWNEAMIDTLKNFTQNYWIKERFYTSRIKNWNVDSVLRLNNLLVPKKAKIDKNYLFVLEINSADTSEWMLLKGIGPVLSRRIVAYRNKLGGFITPDQLMEVYGISPLLIDNIKPYLTVDSLKLSKLDINRASIRQLRDHPYMGFYKAQALIEERRKRGRFNCATELLELPLFNDSGWEKLKHYLAVK